MEIVTLAALAALGMKFVDFIKFITNKDTNSIVTQLAVWASGVLIVFLASAANIAQTLVIAGTQLQDMNGASKVIVGLGLLSAGSVAFDFKKAADNSDTASTPSLIPGSGTYTPPGG